MKRELVSAIKAATEARDQLVARKGVGAYFVGAKRACAQADLEKAITLMRDVLAVARTGFSMTFDHELDRLADNIVQKV